MHTFAASYSHSACVGHSENSNYVSVKMAKQASALALTENEQYAVSVPTTIVLGGTPNAAGEYTGSYTVSVSGQVSQDKTVTISPEDDTVSLRQTGKEAKTASITQAKKSFDKDDFANNTKTAGKITAKALTAGSWVGSVDFLISPAIKNVYYSSVERAAADANNLTTENADVRRDDTEHAVAALTISDSSATIRMMKNENGANSFSLTKDTELNLDGHTLSFANGKYVTFYKSFSCLDGKISGKDSPYVIFGDKSNKDSTTIFKNMSFNGEVSSAHTKNMYIIDISSNTVQSTDNTFTFTGEGTTSGSANCFISRGSNVAVTGTSFNMNIDNPLRARAAQLAGNVTISNCTVNVVSKAGMTEGFRLTGATDKSPRSTVENTTINITTASQSSGNVLGLYFQNASSVDVTDVNIFADATGSNAPEACAIRGVAEKKITITSTTDFTSVYGKDYGLLISTNTGTTEINGGKFSSATHAAQLGETIVANNATFDIDRVEQYSESARPKDIWSPLYVGKSGNTQAERYNADFYNCIFGSAEKSSYTYNCAITSQANNTYIPPENLNLHDCVIYQSANLFGFQGTANNINDSKINLYGSTKLYDVNKNIISKEDFAARNTDWQSKPYSSIESNTLLIGNNFVYGWAKVNKGAIEAKYVTDSTGVYDYRN